MLPIFDVYIGRPLILYNDHSVVMTYKSKTMPTKIKLVKKWT